MVDTFSWLEIGRDELAQILQGPQASDEGAIQTWLERHPAFVPGSRGPRGTSGRLPWPSALITQPRLAGIQTNIPDFCWLASDSAYLTAMLIEIEVPTKPWFTNAGAPSAKLTAARAQITSWRAWFAQPSNVISFLDEYLVPDYLRELTFRQHYILVHGSRKEYEKRPSLARARASATSLVDEDLMSFDRLIEIANPDAAGYGCVKRTGEGFVAIAVPPLWNPDKLSDDALAVTSGYEEAIRESEMPHDMQRERLASLRSVDRGQPPGYRYVRRRR